MKRSNTPRTSGLSSLKVKSAREERASAKEVTSSGGTCRWGGQPCSVLGADDAARQSDQVHEGWSASNPSHKLTVQGGPLTWTPSKTEDSRLPVLR